MLRETFTYSVPQFITRRFDRALVVIACNSVRFAVLFGLSLFVRNTLDQTYNIHGTQTIFIGEKNTLRKSPPEIAFSSLFRRLQG